jgi:hypothetical protein
MLKIPKIKALDLRTGFHRMDPTRSFFEPDDWFQTRRYFGRFGVGGPVVSVQVSAADIEWGWPVVPACAGGPVLVNLAHARQHAVALLRGLDVRG